MFCNRQQEEDLLVTTNTTSDSEAQSLRSSHRSSNEHFLVPVMSSTLFSLRGRDNYRKREKFFGMILHDFVKIHQQHCSTNPWQQTTIVITKGAVGGPDGGAALGLGQLGIHSGRTPILHLHSIAAH